MSADRSIRSGGVPLAPARDLPASDLPELDLDNPEQDDEDAQAQTVAAAAYRSDNHEPELGDSDKVSSGDDSDDVQDLVDHMRQMTSSGRIDMSAFAGERNDDEEEGRYGPAAEDD